jgi:hypothetical protein
MASAVYPKALISFLSGSINLSSANIKAILVDSADETYNAADEFLSDITPAAIVATSGNLASKTLGVVGTGVFDAADITIPTVTGDGTEAVVVYVDTGSGATSKLLCWLDGVVTPNGADITIQWNASGIFSI